MSKKQQPEECECCQYGGDIKLTEYDGPPHRKNEKNWLCELCSSTFAGSSLDYPSQYPEAKTLQTICYVGNVILDAIKKSKQP